MITRISPVKKRIYCFHWKFPFFWKEIVSSYKIQKWKNGEWEDV